MEYTRTTIRTIFSADVWINGGHVQTWCIPLEAFASNETTSNHHVADRVHLHTLYLKIARKLFKLLKKRKKNPEKNVIQIHISHFKKKNVNYKLA